jgi:hypothetical protein
MAHAAFIFFSALTIAQPTVAALLAPFHENTNKNANNVVTKLIHYVQQTKWNRQLGIPSKI